MTTTTLIQIHPNDFTKQVVDELLKQLAGTPTTGATAIPVDELPYLSKSQAAHYLGCSESHIDTLVNRYPDKLKPLIFTKKNKQGEIKNSATKYDPKELHYLKSKNLVK